MSASGSQHGDDHRKDENSEHGDETKGDATSSRDYGAGHKERVNESSEAHPEQDSRASTITESSPSRTSTYATPVEQSPRHDQVEHQSEQHEHKAEDGSRPPSRRSSTSTTTTSKRNSEQAEAGDLPGPEQAQGGTSVRSSVASAESSTRTSNESGSSLLETPVSTASSIDDHHAPESHTKTESASSQEPLQLSKLSSETDRPHSFATPETPSDPIDPRQAFDGNEGHHSGQDAEWRDSVASTSALDTVPLTDIASSSSTRDSMRSRVTLDSVDMEAGPSTPSARYSASFANSHDHNISRHSETAKSNSGSMSDVEMLKHHVEHQQHELEQDPNAKRKSMAAHADLQAHFDKMRLEAQQERREGEKSKSRQSLGDGEVAIDWDFWGEIMSDYEGMAKTKPKELAKAIQNGIPPALRGMMWQLMSASKDADLEEIYSALIRRQSPHEKAIARDLNRTFPTHEYFHDGAGIGQNHLLNLLKAYSLYDPEVGYCQGMGFVAGPLLLNMPDEEAFCVLVRLMKSYDLRSQYIPDMPGLQLRLFQFDRLLEELLPAVFMHLLRRGIKSSMYASQWFMTLLAYRFPLELVCSVFDLIFAEGVEAIFRFALALMRRNEKRILELDFEDLLEFLKSGLFERYKDELSDDASTASSDKPAYNAKNFMSEALQVKITPLMLDQFAAEWTESCRQQNAQNEEVEQLRAINKKLSNQVRSLEASLAQINEEHCELVKQVVATRLEKEELEDELVRVKMALAQESLLREEGRASRGSLASFASFSGYPGPVVSDGTSDRRESKNS